MHAGILENARQILRFYINYLSSDLKGAIKCLIDSVVKISMNDND